MNSPELNEAIRAMRLAIDDRESLAESGKSVACQIISLAWIALCFTPQTPESDGWFQVLEKAGALK